MIIDIHNIIGHHKYKPFVSAESLIAQMDQAGVDKRWFSATPKAWTTPMSKHR